MRVFTDKRAMRAWSRSERAAGRRVALVPTMGSLHAGHLSLVDVARRHADTVVVSIYVNPTQFDRADDLHAYPRELDADLARLGGAADAIFAPHDMYFRGEPPHETWVEAESLTQTLCGAARPGHFRGVTTVVAKFFHVVEPDVAVFGDKDYQQRRVIERMVRDLDFPIEIVAAPLVRDADGLALSSRNARLSPDARTQALSISRALFAARDAVADGATDAIAVAADARARVEVAGGRVDYVELVDDATLRPIAHLDRPAVLAIAAYFGGVRLIDNIRLS
ncbi:MAG: pantoate--beta-alanine ligase [Deltaproteobacteria bacterium HGW-Deltaproteobacteria-14]|jgi:pantoate--beta-alanine ligase|nr:MAG: pantoate--beta-alanine ligase [Deltaproteobacteria bacterium HGW-Deltaproteobacteria-14]